MYLDMHVHVILYYATCVFMVMLHFSAVNGHTCQYMYMDMHLHVTMYYVTIKCVHNEVNWHRGQ